MANNFKQLEAGTCGRDNLPFRDPLNKERRFIPLRLDDTPIEGSLAQCLYPNWLPADRDFTKLSLWKAENGKRT